MKPLFRSRFFGSKFFVHDQLAVETAASGFLQLACCAADPGGCHIDVLVLIKTIISSGTYNGAFQDLDTFLMLHDIVQALLKLLVLLGRIAFAHSLAGMADHCSYCGCCSCEQLQG